MPAPPRLPGLQSLRRVGDRGAEDVGVPEGFRTLLLHGRRRQVIL